MIDLCVKRVSYFIKDFSLLRELPAFAELEEEVRHFVQIYIDH